MLSLFLQYCRKETSRRFFQTKTSKSKLGAYIFLKLPVCIIYTTKCLAAQVCELESQYIDLGIGTYLEFETIKGLARPK